MRALVIWSLALLSAGPPGGRLAAQEPLVVQPTTAEDRPPAHSPDVAAADGLSWQSRFWNAIGGAALGAGMGYFASQLASGDWDDGRINRHRREWAFVGGSVGLAAGFTFPFLGRGVSIAPHVSSNPRMTITAREMAESAANTAYEAVRLLRPNWLATRRPDLFADPTCAPLERVCEPIQVEVLKVYLDGHRLGGTETLTEINARNIEAIRYFNPAEAVARWGAGHGHGAILVTTIG